MSGTSEMADEQVDCANCPACTMTRLLMEHRGDLARLASLHIEYAEELARDIAVDIVLAMNKQHGDGEADGG